MTYYELLQIPENASAEEIKIAYRNLARRFHPDVFDGCEEDANIVMQALNEAYECLSDPIKKAEYDAFLHSSFEQNSNTSNPEVANGDTCTSGDNTSSPNMHKSVGPTEKSVLKKILIKVLVPILVIAVVRFTFWLPSYVAHGRGYDEGYHDGKTYWQEDGGAEQYTYYLFLEDAYSSLIIWTSNLTYKFYIYEELENHDLDSPEIICSDLAELKIDQESLDNISKLNNPELSKYAVRYNKYIDLLFEHTKQGLNNPDKIYDCHDKVISLLDNINKDYFILQDKLYELLE